MKSFKHHFYLFRKYFQINWILVNYVRSPNSAKRKPRTHVGSLSLSNAYVNLTYVKVYGRGFRSAMFGVLTLVSERTFSIPAQALLDKLDFNISRTSSMSIFGYQRPSGTEHHRD